MMARVSARLRRTGAGILLLSCAAIMGCLAGCAGKREIATQIRFTLTGPSEVAQDLQFYLHDIALLGSDGVAYPLSLVAEPPWQSDRVALVDLADGMDKEQNAMVRGKLNGAAGREFSGIRFTIGVPFDLNHTNPLTAAPPLNRPDLFWTWQLGHKFLRADLVEGSRQWSFHLGSTGCASKSAMRPPASPCAQPNRLTVEIRGIDPLRTPVAVRLDRLIQTMHAVDFGICTGDYVNTPACAQVFPMTGLSLESGVCEGATCSRQRLFGAD